MIAALLFLKTAPVGVIDILIALLFVVILISVASSKRDAKLKNPGNEHYKYYMRNIYFKLLFAVLFGAVYKYYYGGGDTMAYWNGAASLNNLFWESPTQYLKELNMTSGHGLEILHFTPETGYPPGWIYRDPHSFFISKMISVLMIFIGQSYLLITLVFAWITSIVSWKIYELVRFYKITSDWLGAMSILFIPSVSFWCAGISKDTVVLICVFVFLYCIFGIANKLFSKRFYPALLIIFSFWVLFNIRAFMVFTVAGPFFIALSTRIIKKYSDSPALSYIIRFFIISLSAGSFMLFLRFQSEELAKTTNKYLTEAAVSQDDFANNKSYGNKKYDLGITDFSPFGMLKIAPNAILTAIYRPGIWEARSAILLISGLETLVFLYLTFIFFLKGKVLEKIRHIRTNELLIFGLFFVLILAFFAGFTSGLFGVLVRFKAPILPFLLIILTTKSKRLTDELTEI